MTNTTNTPLTQTLNYNTISELPNPLINQQETIQENDINTNIIIIHLLLKRINQ